MKTRGVNRRRFLQYLASSMVMGVDGRMATAHIEKSNGCHVNRVLSWILLAFCLFFFATSVPEIGPSQRLVNWISLHSSQLSLQWLIAIGLVYMVLLSFPFVPAMEIGLALMLMGGTEAIPLVYLFTLGGLTLAFWVGRCFPLQNCLKPAAFSGSAKRTYPFLLLSESRPLPDLRYERYLLLGLLLNTPGNALIGGGGGIAMLSGNSRQFSWEGFVVTTMVSIAPVPIGLLLFDVSVL